MAVSFRGGPARLGCDADTQKLRIGATRTVRQGAAPALRLAGSRTPGLRGSQLPAPRPPGRPGTGATQMPASRASGSAALAVGGLASGGWPALGTRLPGILRPGVAWVVALQLLAHLRIGVQPEAAQVVRDLLRAKVRGQQVEQDRHPAGSEARRLRLAEQLLDAGGQHRRLALLVGK